MKMKAAIAMLGVLSAFMLVGVVGAQSSSVASLAAGLPSGERSAGSLSAEKKGDINGDGQVDVLDLQLCVNVFLGMEEDPDIMKRADVNQDGSVNVLDVQETVNIFLAPPPESTATSTATLTPTVTSTSTPTASTTKTATPTPIFTSLPTATSTPSEDVQPTLPLRAAFYYPWFPEAWTQSGTFPYTNYSPTLGYYDSGDEAVIRQHIAAMQYGNIEAGIASWWGQGHHTDGRITTILSATAGTAFRWSIYYEPEVLGDPRVNQVEADLTYLWERYGGDPSYLRIDGRFVVFVYADPSDGCAMVDRWKLGNTVNAYIVLKVFSGYRLCASQPDGWHQYSPAVAADAQGGFSYSISPGFWKVGESPRLNRNLTRWNGNIRDMIASGADFQLITTFNEWGEGTSVEPADEWESASGYGEYLDALHDNGGVGPTTTPTPTPLVTATPTQTATTPSPSRTPTPTQTAPTPSPSPTPIPTSTLPPGSVVFSAAGDHGATSRTDSTLSQMGRLGLEFHLGLGDMSYSDLTPESAWCGYIQAALGPTFPFQLIGGNHEEDSRKDGFIRNFAACLPDRIGSVGDYGTEYYFDASGIVRVIMIAADLTVDGVNYEYVPGNPHYQWLADTIDDGRAQGIPWVVVGMHKVCITMGNKPCSVGDALMDLLIDEKKVDLILMGHDHDYQRSKQLTCSDVGSFTAACVADDGADGQYTKGEGTVIVIAGIFGGGGFTGINTADSEAGYFAAWMGGNRVCQPACSAVDRGVVRYTVTATRITAELFTNSGDYADSFAID